MSLKFRLDTGYFLRRRLLCLCVLVISFSLLKAQAQDRPNILFAISDDQSFPHASAYGTDWVQTPAFDSVADQGICLLYTSPSPRDRTRSRMPSSA